MSQLGLEMEEGCVMATFVLIQNCSSIFKFDTIYMIIEFCYGVSGYLGGI
jgi:hypothetical protein